MEASKRFHLCAASFPSNFSNRRRVGEKFDLSYPPPWSMGGLGDWRCPLWLSPSRKAFEVLCLRLKIDVILYLIPLHFAFTISV
jgi:hypothetical protein